MPFKCKQHHGPTDLVLSSIGIWELERMWLSVFVSREHSLRVILCRVTGWCLSQQRCKHICSPQAMILCPSVQEAIQANSNSQSWFRSIVLLPRSWALNYLLAVDIKLQLNTFSVFACLCLFFVLLLSTTFLSFFPLFVSLSHTLTWLLTTESLHNEVRRVGLCIEDAGQMKCPVVQEVTTGGCD